MDRKKYLAEIISDQYQEFVYVKLFEILNTNLFSSNTNGIFINLNNIPDDIIEDSIRFIESINDSISSYKDGEIIRNDHLISMKKTITEGTRTIVKPKIIEKKKTKALKTIKEPELKGVFKRIQECMGRKGYHKKLEEPEFSPSSDEDNEDNEDKDDNEDNEDKVDDIVNEDDEELTLAELGLED